MDWQLQDAKNKFSEVVKRAQTEGPQVVTLRGQRAAVILSAEAFDAYAVQKTSLVDHILQGPDISDADVEAINARQKAPTRTDVF